MTQIPIVIIPRHSRDKFYELGQVITSIPFGMYDKFEALRVCSQTISELDNLVPRPMADAFMTGYKEPARKIAIVLLLRVVRDFIKFCEKNNAFLTLIPMLVTTEIALIEILTLTPLEVSVV